MDDWAPSRRPNSPRQRPRKRPLVDPGASQRGAIGEPAVPPDKHNLLERQTQMQWVYEGDAMVYRNVSYNPVLYTIFDEILTYAAHRGNYHTEDIDDLSVNIKLDKCGISIARHGVQLPIEDDGFNPWEIFFCNNSSISNHISELINSQDSFIFSKFMMKTTDGHGRKCRKVFYEKLGKKKNVKITTCPNGELWTMVTFSPNLEILNMDRLEDDIVALMRRRVIDLAGIHGKRLKVELDGHVLHNNFPDYVDLYLQSASKERSKNVPRVYQKLNKLWEVCVSLSNNGQFQQISFVNGIATYGGAHVDTITSHIEKHLISAVKRKSRNAVIQPNHVKSHLWVFINASLLNATFDSHAQRTLITPINLDIYFDGSVEFNKFLTQVADSFIFKEVFRCAMLRLNKALALREADESSKLTVEAIPKLDDATRAGGEDSDKCTLIITEGDSAKSLANVGLGEVGRDYYGVFPLKGKLLNVRDARLEKILGNKEINDLRRIIGLDYTKEYYDTKDLRYGHIMIMTDQDPDGSHIKGLLINFFHVFWPSLLKIPSFLSEFVTPLVKATDHTGKNQYFYAMPEYESWVRKSPRGRFKWMVYQVL